MPKNVASHACKSVTLAAWSRRHTWRFLILRNRNRRSRWIWSPAIFATDRCRLRRCGTSTLFPGSIEKSCDKIAQPDWFTLLAIRSDERTGALGEFNRRYLTCQISAISYADRAIGENALSLHRAHLAIFTDRGDQRIKLPGVSASIAGEIAGVQIHRDRRIWLRRIKNRQVWRRKAARDPARQLGLPKKQHENATPPNWYDDNGRDLTFIYLKQGIVDQVTNFDMFSFHCLSTPNSFSLSLRNRTTWQSNRPCLPLTNHDILLNSVQ